MNRSDLSDKELIRFENAIDTDYDALVDIAARLGYEVRRHRAMVRRLEEWAAQLDANRDDPGHVGHFIAAELRNRMKGDGNG